MIEIKILDKNFEQVGLIDNFESFFITRKLYDLTTCELNTIKEYLYMFDLGFYIYVDDKNIFEINEISLNEVSESKNNSGIVIKGVELLNKLSKKVINKTYNFENTPIQDILTILIDNICINNPDTKRNINNLRINNTITGTEIISKQITYEPINKIIFDMAKTYNIYTQINYNFENNELYIDFNEGLDRTYNQNINSFAVFSEEFENISNINFTINNEDYYNYLFIAGEGEGEERKTEVLDLRISENEELKELYIDAKDVKTQDENNNPINIETYKKMLLERGREKSEEYKIIYDIQAEILTTSNLKYKIDFDMGDLCVLVIGNMYLNIRLTEINEVYENGYFKIEVSLGNLKPTLKEFIKREVNKQ